jgi:hypothetical protein
MAILESVRELASKLGADTNGRTIADQINIINQHLEADTANDIAGAVKEYSKKAGSGGGGGETHQVTLTFTYEGSSVSFSSSETFSDIVDIIDNGDIIDFTMDLTSQGTTYTYPSVVYKYDTSSKILKILGDVYSEEYSKYTYLVVYWGDPSVYESQTIAEDEAGILTIM